MGAFSSRALKTALFLSLIAVGASAAVRPVKPLRRQIEKTKKELKQSENQSREIEKRIETLQIQKSSIEQRIKTVRSRVRNGLKHFGMALIEQDSQSGLEDIHGQKAVDSHEERIRHRFIVKKNKTDLDILRQETAKLAQVHEQIEKERLGLQRSSNELKERLMALLAQESAAKVAMESARLRSGEGRLIKNRAEGGGSNSTTFSALRGKLPMPVSGRVISSFGKSYDPKTKLLTFQKGIQIEAKDGEAVRTIASGKVAYAGSLKNYGNVVIVEHPGQHFSLYGSLAQIRTNTGRRVQEGDVLGIASIEAVYFEIRDRNMATNPMEWVLSKR